MEEKGGAWTLVARFSNNDQPNWMKTSGEWWFDRTNDVGDSADPSTNNDMISVAFWTVSGREFKITRSDDPQHTALLQTTGDCLHGQTFRANITSYGDFTNGKSWKIRANEDGCRGSCNVLYAGSYKETAGFQQANCSGQIQSSNKISFWCGIGSRGSVLMIGGGGDASVRIRRSRDWNNSKQSFL